MRFDFSDEQYALRDAVRDLFEKEASASRLREIWKGGPRDGRLWQALAEMGVLGLTIPEQYGGAGGDETDLALVLEEAGRAAVPEPLVETVAVGASMIASFGTEARKQEWLPRIARGDAVITVALAGMPFAHDAENADALIIEHNARLHLLARDQYEAVPIKTEDSSRALFKITQTTEFSDATRLGDASAVVDAFQRGAAATSGVLNGIAMKMLDMTVAYVRGREQFGRPVGSFQAVKHKLASAAVMIESSRSATWYAAYALARILPDCGVATSAAKAYASEAESFMNTEALQCHGGIGFTWEHDLHLWLKRGKALEQSFGSSREHRALLARRIFDEVRDA
jgi:alkylation response protein AidB-like acyl-CoA dehydrogenase